VRNVDIFLGPQTSALGFPHDKVQFTLRFGVDVTAILPQLPSLDPTGIGEREFRTAKRFNLRPVGEYNIDRSGRVIRGDVDFSRGLAHLKDILGLTPKPCDLLKLF